MRHPVVPTKKHFRLVALGTLISLLILLLFARVRKQEIHRYMTPDDFRRLKPGMTQSEVEAILGPPHEVLTWKSPKHTKITIPDSPRHIISVYYGPIEESPPFRKRPFLYLNIDAEQGELKTWGEGSDGGIVSKSVWDRIRDWFAKLF
jgi:hypothetical protein